MPSTYDSIATQTLNGSSATITFSSLPSTFTDFRVVFNGGVTSGGANLYTQCNGDSTNTYSYTSISGDGSAPTAQRGTISGSLLSNYYGYMSADLNTTITLDFMNASNTNTFKTILIRSNNVSNGVAVHAGRWSKTPERITSLTFSVVSSTFLTGSTFSIYGIKAV